MSDYGLRQSKRILEEAGIPFTERYGFSEFHYTALVFQDARTARKAVKALNITGIGPHEIGEGKWEIVYYG